MIELIETPLDNHKWERFAQELAKGKTGDQAYEDAGYKPNRNNASRLKANDLIIGRVKYLQSLMIEKMVISKQHLTERLLRNIDFAMGLKPVTIGKEGEENRFFVYRGDVANRAINMAGLEIGMFVQKSEIKHLNEYEDMTDEELVLELSREAQKLLEHVGMKDVTPKKDDGG